MKKIFTLLTITAAFTATQAQTGLQVGADLGFNSTWIVNQNNYGYQELDYTRTFGMAGGLTFGFNTSETIGFQAELNYVNLGQHYFDIAKDFGPDDGTGKRQKVDTYRFVDLNYFQVPIMFRYQTEKEKKTVVTYHMMLGPSFGFLLSADQHYEADTTYTNEVVTLPTEYAPEPHVIEFAASSTIEEAKDYFSGFDLGLQGELGVDIYVNDNVYISPGFRFNYGLTDINSAPTRELIDDDGLHYEYKGASHNFYGGIYVGCHINLGGESN